MGVCGNCLRADGHWPACILHMPRLEPVVIVGLVGLIEWNWLNKSGYADIHTREEVVRVPLDAELAQTLSEIGYKRVKITIEQDK